MTQHGDCVRYFSPHKTDPTLPGFELATPQASRHKKFNINHEPLVNMDYSATQQHNIQQWSRATT